MFANVLDARILSLESAGQGHSNCNGYPQYSIGNFMVSFFRLNLILI